MQENREKRSIFSGLSILNNQEWLHDQALVVEDNVIKAIIPKDMQQHHLPAKRFEFDHRYYLVPGFIDLHIHGANGHDVMDGTLLALQHISETLAKEGVTSFLATTMTASIERLEAVLQVVSRAMQKVTHAAILGAHLEGPFIAKAGAQCTQHLAQPNVGAFKKLQMAAKNSIKMVTVAPELKNIAALIDAILESGAIASVGHTDATYEETMAAIDKGCTHATHLFNAMRGIHHREPGAAGALLTSNASVELIVDDYHLHPGIVKLAYQAKGKEHIHLVTDAMRAKCLGNGEYELGGQSVIVQGSKATLRDGTLAGSTLRMPQAIKNMMRASGCSLIAACEMASFNPARLMKLANKKGQIAVGYDADLVVLSEDIEVVLTMREGNVIFEK